MNFCSVCGHTVVSRIPDGDNRPRFCCDQCGTIHYQNPRVVVGTVPVWEDKILLCRRAIEPRLGYWTLPAGFMENEETTSEGAHRETIEEAGANIVMGDVFTILDVVHVHQVHMFYLARLINTEFDPGTESLEVQLFSEAEIPWKNLAFRTVTETLRHFFDDRARGHFGTHTGAIAWPPRPADRAVAEPPVEAQALIPGQA